MLKCAKNHGNWLRRFEDISKMWAFCMQTVVISNLWRLYYWDLHASAESCVKVNTVGDNISHDASWRKPLDRLLYTRCSSFTSRGYYLGLLEGGGFWVLESNRIESNWLIYGTESNRIVFFFPESPITTAGVKEGPADCIRISEVSAA